MPKGRGEAAETVPGDVKVPQGELVNVWGGAGGGEWVWSSDDDTISTK